MMVGMLAAGRPRGRGAARWDTSRANVDAGGPPGHLPEAMTWLGLTLRLSLRCAGNPRLLVDLVRVAWRFRSRDWLRRPPWLPLPDMDYVRWRMHTVYGDHHAVPPVDDVIRYARWVRHAS